MTSTNIINQLKIKIKQMEDDRYDLIEIHTARYAVHDPDAAAECIAENNILRRITSDTIEANDGLFVAIDDSD